METYDFVTDPLKIWKAHWMSGVVVVDADGAHRLSALDACMMPWEGGQKVSWVIFTAKEDEMR